MESGNKVQSKSMCVGNARAYLTTVTCDQEAWIKDDIYKAIVAGIRLSQESLDRQVFDSTLDGLVNGTVLEILDTLNIKTEYVNLRKVF